MRGRGFGLRVQGLGSAFLVSHFWFLQLANLVCMLVFVYVMLVLWMKVSIMLGSWDGFNVYSRAQRLGRVYGSWFREGFRIEVQVHNVDLLLITPPPPSQLIFVSGRPAGGRAVLSRDVENPKPHSDNLDPN